MREPWGAGRSTLPAGGENRPVRKEGRGAGAGETDVPTSRTGTLGAIKNLTLKGDGGARVRVGEERKNEETHGRASEKEDGAM